MEFLSRFTLYDVFLVAIGLMTACIIRIFYDSHKKRKILEELDALVSVYNESMNAYSEGVMIISDSQEVLFANKEIRRILRITKDELSMEHLREKVLLRTQNSIKEVKFFDALKENDALPNVEIMIGTYTLAVAASSHIFETKSATEKSILWRIITLRDISGQIKLQKKKENTGMSKDILTGLPVKHHLLSKLPKVIATMMQSQETGALGMLGIENYHDIQSRYGIEKMDILINSIAKVASKEMKEKEIFYRFDHDNFAILFEAISDESKVRERMSSLRERIKEVLVIQGIDTGITNGVYFIENPYPTANRVIDGCLGMLYAKSATQSKKHDRSFSLKEEKGKIKDGEKLDKKAFKSAIKNNDFFFFYQPIYALKNETLIGVEVLSRLNYKKEGILMPDLFLPQAIESNMMTEVTAHLLDRVLSQKMFWLAQMGKDIDTTINLGISDIRSGVFTEMLEQKILEYHIDPATITIDISEEILEMEYEAVFEECYMLSKLGVKLAVDHFGRGSITLRNLATLPLYSIKMGAPLVSHIAEKEEKLRLVSGVISMGRKMDIQVGATFVDSENIKTLLHRMGCHFAQGNYLGKPMPAFEVADLVRNA